MRDHVLYLRKLAERFSDDNMGVDSGYCGLAADALETEKKLRVQLAGDSQKHRDWAGRKR